MNNVGKVCEKVKDLHVLNNDFIFAQSFSMVFRVEIHGVLHVICTFWIIFLTIDALLNFFDLVTEGEV